MWKIEPKACPPNSGVAFAAKHIAINADTDTHEVENEINILKGCKSPYIVSYYGVFRQDTLLWVGGEPYHSFVPFFVIHSFQIIMDYCELGSVLDMMELTESELSEASTAWLVKSTLHGLAYLHSKGVVHRYVSFDNEKSNSKSIIQGRKGG